MSLVPSLLAQFMVSILEMLVRFRGLTFCLTLSAASANTILDDPPFYLNRKPFSDGNSACAVHSDGSSSHRFDPMEAPSHASTNIGRPTAPTRSLLTYLESSENNTDDFRNVIDDLTVQNKKLRRRLKNYEKLHCSHLQEGKLFEVRFHGLAAHRKRELEETLRSFASSIEPESERPFSDPTVMPASTLTKPLGALHKTSSSSTSYSRPIDSAYASMSGQTGLSHSQLHDQTQQDRSVYALQVNQQNVKSYLHDIPETLMPKHSLGMSERSKSKVVVKRLERIFTGKGATSHQHNQSHQQQEISRSAAQEDKSKLEARGRRQHARKEGIREARILPNGAELQVDSLSEATLAAQKSRQSHDGEESRSRTSHLSRDISPDQRSTRPLDLDLQRAQVPSDNLEYIRHLGLASPTDVDVGDGWIYLNLLISMAQLHTLNVTPEFIRHTVTAVSTKLELSEDGTKVRWQGGNEGTILSSDGDESDDGTKSKPLDPSFPISNRGSIVDLQSRPDFRESQEPKPTPSAPELLLDPQIGSEHRPVFLGETSGGSKLQYKPLFFHGVPTDKDDDSDHMSVSASSSGLGENLSGINSGSLEGQESEVRLRRQDRRNGPIIFYSKARFYTDLSGDPVGSTINKGAYCRYSQVPLGCLPTKLNNSEDGNAVDRKKSDSMAADIESTKSTHLALDLEDLRSSISDCFSSRSPPKGPILMEASGLGGTQPEDNFIVEVQVRHDKNRARQSPGKMSSSPSPKGNVRQVLHSLLLGSMDVFREPKDIPRSQPSRVPVESEIISTVKSDLPPSSLPPPSYVCIPFSSSESEQDDDEDDEARVLCNAVGAPAALRPPVEDFVGYTAADFFMGSLSEESKDPSYISTSSDSDEDLSIDLLAHARVLDPDTIAARERDFDNNAVQQLGDVPAGSSAATAGGGSGCASQSSKTPWNAKDAESADGMSVDESSGNASGDSI